ncbi:hypothetical protein Sinac_5833 [Singulisphaera acidiphila DSM 18658]|uniref:Uncharacterized protein n=1 Tax=Singulisphaera acidiphila (strain ATCC BAA-1392 / DSM 18658 / VKM B-2454 / MOB10) TaxID=886293 RepID=L0DMB4_SINAD|nr:hypothetical protein Sinac_5833 [Singulisphaera acidiphila DSM 18658]
MMMQSYRADRPPYQYFGLGPLLPGQDSILILKSPPGPPPLHEIRSSR